MKILHIDTSIAGEQSITRALTSELVARLRASHPGVSVDHLDLAQDPLPHLDLAPSPQQAQRGEQVLQQFEHADIVVIGAPMYNFTIPSTLKAWIDRIAVAGRTFRYTEQGALGLSGNKEVFVVVSSGGQHAGQPTDFVEPYLRQLFGFLGVERLHVLRADGVALSPDHRANALSLAREKIASPLPTLLAG